MQTIHKNIYINASRQKVWNTMLEDSTYREWTSAFHKGSYYKGEWKEGTDILFLGPNEDGQGEGGIKMHIKELKPYESVLMECVAVIEDDTEVSTEEWAGATESYAFTVKEGGTELIVSTDITDEMVQEMSEMWDKSLEKLKEITER